LLFQSVTVLTDSVATERGAGVRRSGHATGRERAALIDVLRIELAELS